MEAWREELYHHGILGQKWGHQNGPPYPLDAGDHSASEKKAGWKKSLSNNKQTKKSKKETKAEQVRKKRIKTALQAVGAAGAAALISGTAAYGSMKVADFLMELPDNLKSAAMAYVQSDNHYYKDSTGTLSGAIANGKDWVMNYIFDHS